MRIHILDSGLWSCLPYYDNPIVIMEKVHKYDVIFVHLRIDPNHQPNYDLPPDTMQLYLFYTLAGRYSVSGTLYKSRCLLVLCLECRNFSGLS